MMTTKAFAFLLLLACTSFVVGQNAYFQEARNLRAANDEEKALKRNYRLLNVGPRPDSDHVDMPLTMAPVDHPASKGKGGKGGKGGSKSGKSGSKGSGKAGKGSSKGMSDSSSGKGGKGGSKGSSSTGKSGKG